MSLARRAISIEKASLTITEMVALKVHGFPFKGKPPRRQRNLYEAVAATICVQTTALVSSVKNVVNATQVNANLATSEIGNVVNATPESANIARTPLVLLAREVKWL